MDLYLLYTGLGIGFILGLVCRFPIPKEKTLRLMLAIDCTRPVHVSASAKDAEGNDIPLADTDLVLTATGTNDKDFGTINDENDTFNPGEAGAIGTITGTVTLDGKPFSDSVDIALVVGAPASLSLDFKPV